MSAELISLTAEATEYDVRLATLRSRMATRGLDAVAFASPETIYYLTGLDHFGYFTFTLLIVPLQAEPSVVARTMEAPTIRAQIPQCAHYGFGEDDDPATVAACALAEAAPFGGSIGVEDSTMFFPPAVYARIRGRLADHVWCEAGGLLSADMVVKSPSEIERMRQAAGTSDAAMQAGIAAAHTEAPEQDVAAAIHREMFSQGSQQPGFAPLIRPLWMLDQEHVSWGARSLSPGTGLFIELSGCIRRYHAPLARTIYIGHAPDDAYRAHDAAVTGLEAARQALRPDALTGDVYESWRRAVGKRVADDARNLPGRHHCGYQVGIGFPPSWVGGGEVIGIRPGGTTPIQPGMTFHLMSWVPGHVVSDTVLVTATGAELLTSAPRELTITP